MESGYIIKNSARITAREVPSSNESSECICYRPHSNIICNGCGFWTRGRVRYCCPQHPKVTVISIFYSLYFSLFLKVLFFLLVEDKNDIQTVNLRQI